VDAARLRYGSNAERRPEAIGGSFPAPLVPPKAGTHSFREQGNAETLDARSPGHERQA
jgi:hypothetical protein